MDKQQDPTVYHTDTGNYIQHPMTNHNEKKSIRDI